MWFEVEGCDDELIGIYDDPRIDRDARGTLYLLRICDPADGWFSSYNFSCVVAALRWTLSQTKRGSLQKISDAASLGLCFEMKDAEAKVEPVSKPGPVRCWSIHHEEQGYRESMEDVVLALDEFSLGMEYDTAKAVQAMNSNAKEIKSLQFYAVFDGHGGEYAAQYAGKHLPVHLRNCLGAESGVREALWDACTLTDSELFAEMDKQFVPDTSGSTMCCVVIDNNGVLHCANIGDSRAVLCRAGKAVPLSSDQKADDPNEIGRIVECGGFVTESRVMGDLAVARAFGDYDFKPEEQCVITADPDIFSMQLDCVADEFIIVACDGLWDVMSSAEVVNYCIEWMCNNKPPSTVGPQNQNDTAQADYYQRLLAELVEHAVETLGSSDNVSVILVLLANPEADPPTLNFRKRLQNRSSDAEVQILSYVRCKRCRHCF